MSLNQNRFIRSVLYRLKRDFGSPADIYYETTDTADLSTGQRAVAVQKWHIERAIPLPRQIDQQSVTAQALKELFNRGGNVVVGDRQVLIDRRDLPNRFVLGTENWYLIIDGHRYQIVSVSEYEGQSAYIVTLKETVGAERDATVEMTLHDRLNVYHEGNPQFGTSTVPMNVTDTLHVVHNNYPEAIGAGTDVEITVEDTVNVTGGLL